MYMYLCEYYMYMNLVNIFRGVGPPPLETYNTLYLNFLGTFLLPGFFP